MDDPPKTQLNPTTTTSPTVRPVIELSRFNAFPPTTRARELSKAANTFTSSGKTIFVHYAEPILRTRRALLLESGTTRKKFYKTATQLWPNAEEFFWNQQATELRLSLKQKFLSVEDCLEFAGRPGDARVCSWYAEVGVSEYLGTPPPAPFDEEVASAEQRATSMKSVSKEDELNAVHTVTFAEHPAVDIDEHNGLTTPAHLDVLPDSIKPPPRNSTYGNFAHLDLPSIRHASGRTQTMYLRRVAQMLDETGKELFHHYMVPQLCATIQPRPDGSTVTGISSEVWRFLPGERRLVWWGASRGLKKRLGDGEVEALETLELGGTDTEGLRLQGLAGEEWEGHQMRRTVRWGEK